MMSDITLGSAWLHGAAVGHAEAVLAPADMHQVPLSTTLHLCRPASNPTSVGRTSCCTTVLTPPFWPPCRRSRPSARSTPRASWRTLSPTTRPPAAMSLCRARYGHVVTSSCSM